MFENKLRSSKLLPLNFDENYPNHERLPQVFRVEFIKKANSSLGLSWNGVFIGDNLTYDKNIDDGYRFHDVFHFAYAAILHWSPIVRDMLKLKRKSNSVIDREQDGGKAQVIEESISIWLFTFAKEHNFFKNIESLPPHIKKFIKKITKGLEVEECSISLWEKAIFDGYHVFRKLLENDGGGIVGNRENRSLQYFRSS